MKRAMPGLMPPRCVSSSPGIPPLAGTGPTRSPLIVGEDVHRAVLGPSGQTVWRILPDALIAELHGPGPSSLRGRRVGVGPEYRPRLRSGMLCEREQALGWIRG